MQLQTSRLILGEIVDDDLQAIHAMNSIPEVDEFNTLGLPENIDTTRTLVNGWIREQAAEPRIGYTFSMKSAESGKLIGMIALMLDRAKYRKAEVWYKTLPEYWGNGYTTEALKIILNFAFRDLNLHRVEAGCATANIGSVKVLEKVGMTREGLCRKTLPIRGEWVDNYMYAILDTDIR